MDRLIDTAKRLAVLGLCNLMGAHIVNVLRNKADAVVIGNMHGGTYEVVYLEPLRSGLESYAHVFIGKNGRPVVQRSNKKRRWWRFWEKNKLLSMARRHALGLWKDTGIKDILHTVDFYIGALNIDGKPYRLIYTGIQYYDPHLVLPDMMVAYMDHKYYVALNHYRYLDDGEKRALDIYRYDSGLLAHVTASLLYMIAYRLREQGVLHRLDVDNHMMLFYSLVEKLKI